MTDNNGSIPSTPSWMTDNRPRRSHRKGYGRRYSGLGNGACGIRSTATKVSRRRDLAPFGQPGSVLSPDNGGGEGGGNPLDLSANARLEGRRGLPPRPMRGLGNVDDLDQSAHARLESRPGLDLIDEFEGTSQPRKKRPHLPRPPRARRRAAAGRKHKAGAPGTGSDAFVFEQDAVEMENGNSNSSHDSGADATEGSRDHPIPLLEDNAGGTGGGGGYAKRSKTAFRRSNSATAAVASRSLSLLEENMHPNDTSPDAGKLGANIGTRRSSRLRKARRASVAVSSSSNNNNDATFVTTRSRVRADNNDATFVTTRSRARANSKKRSAAASVTSQNTNAGTCSARPAQVQQRSSPNLRSASAVSISSAGSFSSSTGGAGSGNFSSLARQCSDMTWASGSETAALSKSFSRSKSNSSSGISASATTLKTPSSNDSPQFRSVSQGGDPPSAGSGTTLGAESFLSPGGGGTNPMPLAGSSSSRKRSCADFAAPSPPDSDSESPGGSQRVSRSRKGEGDGLGGSERFPGTRRGPPRFSTNGATGEEDGLGGSERFPRTRKGSTPQFVADRRISASTVLPDGGPMTTGIFSPPSKSSFVNVLASEMKFFGSDDEFAEDNGGVRDRLSSNDDSSMSTESVGEDSCCRSAEDKDEDESDDDASDTQREMTDAEVFEAKPSHGDFKFLARSLQKWSKTSHGRGASMGLNGGCLIALPPGWTSEHRARFARWATTAFGFRAGSVGGAGGGTFLRCCDGEGREASARLRRILNDHKAGRLTLPKDRDRGVNQVAAGKERSEKPLHGREKPKAKLPIKLSCMQRSSSMPKKGPPELSMSPICDGFVGDLLAHEMKSVTLDETKPFKSNTPGSNYSVPRFIPSITLKPLANKVKPVALPCFRNDSPTIESKGRRPSGGGGEMRPPRLSAESAIHDSDLLNQLHAGCGNSPSPLPNCLLGRYRSRAARALQPAAARRPSLEKVSFRSSFERPTGGQRQGCLKSFESPHPRTSLELGTPSDRPEFGLETPMPKQVEHWGSRPVSGKDWGESACCCDSTADACSQIFAKSWFTSDYYGNEDLSAQNQMSLDADDESYLFSFYEADADIDDDDDAVDSEVCSINRDSLGDFPTESTPRKIGLSRCESVGATAMDLLNLDDNPSFDRRRTMKLRKYARMSLCVAVASDYLHQPKLKRKNRMSEPPRKWSFSTGSSTPINSIMDSNNSFSVVLSFLNEGELLHAASLVCTEWADRAAEALGNLMLVSVGCDPSLNDKEADDDFSSDGAGEAEPVDDQADVSAFSSVAKSMERDWPYLMHRFPWAKFLSDGSFKRVYKVWNDNCGAYEALSVMDVDAIDDMGNSSLVGTELAVSVLLSSLARRNICPNFVITRGVFTCPHEPPARLWGCRDDTAPSGATYAGRKAHASRAPKPGQCGNFQYIRMELCQHGDIEEFIKSRPEKILTPWDCRNLLFQMAFALHVASDRFGLKHYDVKLLNFFLQSAKDPTIADEQHPHVVLRYGVGSHVFRLRMHPSSAHIAKLADYGTSVMRADTDGHPVTIGQFTTLENTPPEYLILGNAAEQGYGHDRFGLGLCMLHLFTGHGPYEEILDEVFCPSNLKQQLRKVWKQRSHNVICSVMFDNDEQGKEIEDETLYDTLYRYLVLFGIPKQQFDIKKHGKVWSAINSTLLPPKGSRLKKCPDIYAFEEHRKKFSLAHGTDRRIAGARLRLLEMDGAMELLLSLVSFDPNRRATPLDVINSSFMSDLRENNRIFYCKADIVKSYTAYLANAELSIEA